MKIMINLDSKELNKAVETQVAKEVARITTEAISAKTDEIISLKLSRVTKPIVDDALNRKVLSLVESIYEPYVIRAKIDAAILKLVKETLKKSQES